MQAALDLAGLSEIPADSMVYVPGSGVRRVLFGVDIDAGDLLYAREAGFDLVIAHHPVGDTAHTRFTDVMWGMVDQMREEGVSEEVARAAVATRVRKIARRRHTANYNRVVDAARLIGLPLMNIHLPPDIVARRFVQEWVRERVAADATVEGLLLALNEIPEMRASQVKPEVWIGDAGNPVGRWSVQMAGGTNGGFPVFSTLYAAGVDTILAMHIDEDEFRALEQGARSGANLVITGHMPSDSIGINALIRHLEGRGLEVTRTSGVL